LTSPIVAIGASAGGLEAVSELLAALPRKSDMAYVVVQHLDPGHHSLLAELLAKKTAMPVVQVHDGVRIEASHVYVIPPNATLTLLGEQLHLKPRPTEGPHHPVDILFTSLAEARADAAIGVVLSGGDSDGSLGVQAIKHSGGITFAQDPQSARFPSMPHNAIETGCVDFVLRPSDIAHELMRLGRHAYLRAVPTPRSVAQEDADVAREEESLRHVFRRLRSAHGLDFAHYKRSTLRRRLARRMAVRKVDELDDYVAVLLDDPAEAAALYQDFLIRVTGFFRDPESFEGLAAQVFPRVCEGRSPKDPIRIWVPGCATGEEVYSIAIALVEYLGDRVSSAGIQIFGTDVSEVSIEKARAACYVDNIVQQVSDERLRRFFVKEDSHYRIAKSIRDLCIFARQDVTRDPPFSRLDLVSCRNLLIYLDAAAQRRVMQVFHYSLRPQGFLMLGPSESVGAASDLFDLVDKQHRLYTRKTTGSGGALTLGQRGAALSNPSRAMADEESPILAEVDSVQREADRILMAHYAPASLLVDESLNILQIRGETGHFLELASGPASLNLNRVARPELLVELSPAIAEARETGSVARRDGLSVHDLTEVALKVIPLKASSTERCYLIVLEDASQPSNGRRASAAARSALPESEKDRRLMQLEREVVSTRDYLQATMEEHEAAKEELKSAHEEVLSANEEFQSTNEELETAKEELQSANEELITTNDELRNRNAEMQKARETSEHARAYADVIVETVREALLVLDGDLKILRANRAFYSRFTTRPEQTEGHLLPEIGAGQLNRADLLGQLRLVLTQNAAIDNYEVGYSVPMQGLRTLSLSARKIPGDAGRGELVLLAIEDVTERKAVAEQLRDESKRKDEFLAMLAHELRNPLSPIMHAVHLLRRGVAGTSAPKFYDMIERQTRRLVRLVDELLDVARISRGHIELKRESVDLADIARHAAEASRGRIGEYHHDLVLAFADAPVQVEGDPVRLEQIISNLIENAAKYTEPGGHIALKITQENDEAVLSVRDNGIGLAPEQLETIFDLFAQVDSSPARSGGGLGIGLTLVRRVLELHGGRIEARSAGLGHGSEFIVRLPLQSSNSAGPPDTARNTLATVRTDHPRRVLIVDDSSDTAESMALLARSWGHEVVIASDGPTALVLAEQFAPERALVDIGLPGMNGYELARRLREKAQHRDLYLIAVTGYGREGDKKAAEAAGFNMHLVKPGDIDRLRELLSGG
jgi:two-component system CheB/CheR fusion protein